LRVQSREQVGIPFPAEASGLVVVDAKADWQRIHPCPKPVEEVSFLIKHLTRPGQIVLDPFAGTGSGLVAARRLDRHYIGAEISPTYANVTKWALAGAR
jgi:DNA modification methylase